VPESRHLQQYPPAREKTIRVPVHTGARRVVSISARIGGRGGKVRQ
jgi:hypothetical protein